ncbi:MAG: BrnA antitoxin family protein [Acetobacteraceae bacterium]|nr:BrnA antitoxin family protein [Acetobacteraceae bacterium]
MRELTADDFKAMRPRVEVDPCMVDVIEAMRNKGGRPKVENPRESIAFRWDRDLVAIIKATGKNYNARVEKVLRDAVARGDL